MRNKRAGKAVAALAMGIVVAAGLVAVGAKESGPSLTYHELLVLAGDRLRRPPRSKIWKRRLACRKPSGKKQPLSAS